MAKIISGVGGTSAVQDNGGYNWATGNYNAPTNGAAVWPGVSPAEASFNPVNGGASVWDTNPVQPQTESLLGSTGVNVGSMNIDVAAITNIIRQAVSLYDSGSHDKKLVATDVDILRKKINNKTFDPYNSVELRNIFGYILGDVVSELIQSRGSEYDDILDMIFNNFPEGTGNPVGSSYVKNGSKYANNNTPYGKLISDLKKYINKNGLKHPTTLNKFLKLWEQFKTTKPELDKVDVEAVFSAFHN